MGFVLFAIVLVKLWTVFISWNLKSCRRYCWNIYMFIPCCFFHLVALLVKLGASRSAALPFAALWREFPWGYLVYRANEEFYEKFSSPLEKGLEKIKSTTLYCNKTPRHKLKQKVSPSVKTRQEIRLGHLGSRIPFSDPGYCRVRLHWIGGVMGKFRVEFCLLIFRLILQWWWLYLEDHLTEGPETGLTCPGLGLRLQAGRLR